MRRRLTWWCTGASLLCSVRWLIMGSRLTGLCSRVMEPKVGIVLYVSYISPCRRQLPMDILRQSGVKASYKEYVGERALC